LSGLVVESGAKEVVEGWKKNFDFSYTHTFASAKPWSGLVGGDGHQIVLHIHALSDLI
jgi:hypothetical protein